MKNDYNKLRKKSDKTLKQTKQIISKVLKLDPNIWKIEDTTFDEDTQQASDIKISNGVETLYFAHRVRDAKKYENDYFNEITIRAINKRGHETEFSKFLKGNVDMMFYGFEIDGYVGRWGLGDANAFRNIFHWDEPNGIWVPDPSIICGMKSNEYNSDSDFMWFDIPSIERYLAERGLPKFIIARSPGYHEDIKTTSLPKSDGTKVIMYELKKQENRIDKYEN